MRLKKNLLIGLISLINLSFLLSCANAPGFLGQHHYVGPRIENIKNNCNTVSEYTYDFRYEGYHEGFTSTIHSRVDLDEIDNHYTANDIAHISKLVNEAAKSRFPDLDEWRYVALQKMMAHVHIIVLEDRETQEEFWVTKTTNPFIARTARSLYTCFSPENNTWFYTIRATHFNHQVDTVIHEAMHTVSLVLHDDHNGGDHKDPRYWDEHSDESLQSLVESLWQTALMRGER